MENLTRISRYLMLHSSFIENVGLLNGKMGIVLFFFYYSKFSKKKIHSIFAYELLNQIYENLYENLSWDFSTGLTGIGYSTLCLLNNKFVYTDSNDILEVVDQKIINLEIDSLIHPKKYFELEMLYYYLYFRLEYINSLISKTEIINKMICIKNFLFNNHINGYANIIHFEYIKNTSIDITIKELIYQIEYKASELFINERNICIENGGYSGIGLKILWSK